MKLQTSTPFRTSLYLRLSQAVLATTRGAVKVGWVSPAVLCKALSVSNALSRAAMKRWRRNRQKRLAGTKSYKLKKRSQRG